MKNTVLLLVVASVLLVLSGPGSRGATLQDERAVFTLADVAWMSGHWRQGAGEKQVEELWMPPRGGLMLGLNRTVVPGRRTAFEYLRLEQRPDGVLYLPSPGGRDAGVAFRLVVAEPDRAIFENPEHDFPKVIEYVLEDGRLVATTSGDEPGPSWTYARVGDVD